VAFRPHVVYGPERDVGLTAGPSLAAKAAALGESYTIGYTGSAGYDYVEDVAAALLRGAFECPPGANVVDLPGEQACCHDVIRAIEKAVPEAAGRIRAEGPPLPNNVSPRIHPMTQLFSDWKPIPLLEGMRKTVAFYQSKGVHS
jgi:nucleoside-diphosphate-sugar epimerase